jgi:glycosyltransferase involved in cell wall biosynthesis
MKILLSAFSCEPEHGSERAVGWHWAIELARMGHDVWVITQGRHHGRGIQGYAACNALPASLHFVFVDITWWQFRPSDGLPRMTYSYYYLWQWSAYRKAKALHANIKFDVVHHITWGGMRFPSFMGNLGVPFAFGPVGGGERAPFRLRRGMGWRGWALDALRDLSNVAVRIDPLMLAVFRQARAIYVKTPATAASLPRRWRHKARCLIEIGIDERACRMPPRPAVESGSMRVMFAGRFLSWKGMHLGLPAFAQLQRHIPQSSLTMVGSGPCERRWRKMAHMLSVHDDITWVPWVTRTEMPAMYAAHDVLLFPSLHDSSGNVVLESLLHGLPVVCLDLGGPPLLVNATCGRVIQTAGLSREQVVKALGHALIELAGDPQLRQSLARGAVARAQEFPWSRPVHEVYEDIEAPLQ